MRTFLVVAALTLTGFQTGAHDRWVTGEPVPPWVKAACCGRSDLHHFTVEEVRIEADGYHFPGLRMAVPFGRVLPSPDSDFWVFWNPEVKDPTVYCAFAPAGGS